MKKLLLIVMVSGCAVPQPKPKTPEVTIPVLTRNYIEPQWEEPAKKVRPEQAAEEVRALSYSVMDYVQMQWGHVPP